MQTFTVHCYRDCLEIIERNLLKFNNEVIILKDPPPQRFNLQFEAEDEDHVFDLILEHQHELDDYMCFYDYFIVYEETPITKSCITLKRNWK